MTSLVRQLLLLGAVDERPASQLLQDAISAYERGDDQSARRLLDRAKKAASTEPATLAKAQLYWGLTCRSLGCQPEQAVAAFRAAVILDHDLRLPDEELISPRLREWWTQAGGVLVGKPTPVPVVTPVEPSPVVPPPSVVPEVPADALPAPPRRPSVAPAIALAASAVVIASIGLGFGAWAKDSASRAAAPSLDVEVARREYQQASLRATLANVAFGLAGACALAAGIAFAFTF